MFSPMKFKKKDIIEDLSKNQIDKQELLNLGQVATAAKKRFMHEN